MRRPLPPGGEGAPAVARLLPARPNPSGGRVELLYGLPRAGRVKVTIYDLQGRLVTVVADRVEEAGWRSVEWDGRDDRGRVVGSATYFARLEAAGSTETRKIVLAR